MDWYLMGRMLGAIAWPLAVGAAIYGIGWLVAVSRPPHLADKYKTGARVAAAIGFFAMLFVTLRELLRYGAPS
jgi:hypothetical protein